jgi:hypothetical protein
MNLRRLILGVIFAAALSSAHTVLAGNGLPNRLDCNLAHGAVFGIERTGANPQYKIFYTDGTGEGAFYDYDSVKVDDLPNNSYDISAEASSSPHLKAFIEHGNEQYGGTFDIVFDNSSTLHYRILYCYVVRP